MIEVRIHGRGGQGAVIASKILAKAAHYEGWDVQVFPQFGVERRGAPVVAFLRIKRGTIRIRTHVYTPDHIMVLDPALLNYVDVTNGLKKGGWIVMNAGWPPDVPELVSKWRLATVPASEIAFSHGVGTKTQPIVNTAMVGAFLRVVPIASKDAMIKAIQELIPIKTEANIEAALESYEKVQMSVNPITQDIMNYYEHVTM